ncbi:MAG: TolC family protein, partial [Bacteroidia bacterium]|nr:TolC family protein [Bacteroidia bacterium]
QGLPGTNGFPQVNNVSEQLLPDNFYDARIKTTMPLINPDIRINREIKQKETQLAQNEIDAYKRELVKEIKTAYYNFLSATKAISIFENALTVVRQNLKVNQSLLNNGKGLYAYVSRAESEVSQVQAQLLTAMNEQRNAQAYFNFLLNRTLTDSVEVHNYTMDPSALQGLVAGDGNTMNKREELKSLDLARDINTGMLKLNRSFRLPRLHTFIDLGAQGFDFKVNDQSFFYLAGLQIQVPIFTGKRNLYKIEMAEIALKNLAVNTEYTQKQLNLAAFVSRNNVINSYNNYLASVKQQEASQNYFKLIDRGYKEGINSFIEMLDARNQLTGSQLQVNINTYKYLSALADYERQTATYSFNK